MKHLGGSNGTWSWNGATLSPMPGPAPSGVELSGVSCLDATNCTAVGYHVEPYSTFAEHWDGTAWTMTPIPNPGDAAAYDRLYGVTCTSTSFCVAVGFDLSIPKQNGYVPDQTLIEVWNGSAWSVVPSPNPGALAITTSSLPDGTAGSSYSATLSASGGNPP